MYFFKALPTDLEKLTRGQLFELKEHLDAEAEFYFVVNPEKYYEYKERKEEVEKAITKRDEFRADFALFEKDVKKGDAW